MVSENADMALDDFISKNKIKIGKGGRGEGRGRGRGGRGGGGDRRGGGRNSARDRGGDRGAVSKRGGGGFSNRRNRNIPDRWEHDMYAGGRRENASSGNKLIVNNLDFGVTDADMEELFSEFGTLRKAMILYDRSGRSTGSAEVEFIRSSDARQAKEQYHQVPLDGRAMNIAVMGSRDSGRDSGRDFDREPRREYRRNDRDRSPRGDRNRGGNRRGGRGGGRGGNRNNKEKKEPVTQEQLDAEMEEYLKERTK